jgi:hypothetical protein
MLRNPSRGALGRCATGIFFRNSKKRPSPPPERSSERSCRGYPSIGEELVEEENGEEIAGEEVAGKEVAGEEIVGEKVVAGELAGEELLILMCVCE